MREDEKLVSFNLDLLTYCQGHFVIVIHKNTSRTTYIISASPFLSEF